MKAKYNKLILSCVLVTGLLSASTAMAHKKAEHRHDGSKHSERYVLVPIEQYRSYRKNLPETKLKKYKKLKKFSQYHDDRHRFHRKHKPYYRAHELRKPRFWDYSRNGLTLRYYGGF